MSNTKNTIDAGALIIKANPDRKRCVNNKIIKRNKIPDEILNNEQLNLAIEVLPKNYEFEIHKTIYRIKKANAKCVALQFPEGLTMFACPIADIVETFTDAETVIMGDVTYGACCVDDFSARALGCDFMVHYGHSCLISTNLMPDIEILYVFCYIQIDTKHFVDEVVNHAKKSSIKKIAMFSTVQFTIHLKTTKKELEKQGLEILILKSAPLSQGEVLGCTSPKMDGMGVDCIIYLGDGRFHLESMMIHNPSIPAYAYDPYDKKLTIEGYDHDKMRGTRKEAIETASKAKSWGIIMGTLGRQGAPPVVKDLKKKIAKVTKTEPIIVLLSEIFPSKLRLFSEVDAWVQIACPRLSIDWGSNFDRPLLSPYEANVALGICEFASPYPMDFYAYDSLGPWTPNHSHNKISIKERNRIRSEAMVNPSGY